MRYSGSKYKISKYIVPLIMNELKEGCTYIEPFMGGCNILSKINWPNKIGADSNKYVVALWNKIKNGGPISVEEVSVTEDQYNDMKLLAKREDSTKVYPSWLIGFVGTACSYGSAWFNGYAHFNKKRGENHIVEAYNGLKKQIKEFKHLRTTYFHQWDYRDLFDFFYNDVENSNKYVFYCDPPYRGTKGYKDSSFDSDEFWEQIRRMSKAGFIVFVSEYTAPEDFKCVLTIERKDGMSATKDGQKQGTKYEKIFRYIV